MSVNLTITSCKHKARTDVTKDPTEAVNDIKLRVITNLQNNNDVLPAIFRSIDVLQHSYVV